MSKRKGNFTKSENALFERLVALAAEGKNPSAAAHLLLRTIERHTAGWQREWWQASLRGLAAASGLPKRTIERALPQLRELGLIESRDVKNSHEYRVLPGSETPSKTGHYESGPEFSQCPVDGDIMRESDHRQKRDEITVKNGTVQSPDAPARHENATPKEKRKITAPTGGDAMPTPGEAAATLPKEGGGGNDPMGVPPSAENEARAPADRPRPDLGFSDSSGTRRPPEGDEEDEWDGWEALL